MTLIQIMIDNELTFPTPTRLITVTSDTRNVLRFGKSNKVIHKWNSTNSKINKISPYCLFGGGGDNNIYDFVNSKIIKEEGQYIEDFFISFKKIVEDMKKSKIFRRQMSNDGSSQMFIVGYNRHGIPSIIKYKTGKRNRVKMKTYPLMSTYEVISPSTDENEILTEFYNNPGRRLPETEDGLLGCVLEFMLTAQQACYINDEQSVSDEFVYNAILLRDGEYTSFEDTIKFGDEETG